MTFEERKEKYRTIRERLQRRRKPANDGHVEQFSDFVGFCAEDVGSSLDDILGDGVDEAVRASIADHHIILDGEASAGTEVDTAESA